MARTDLSLPQGRGFTIADFLTADEASELVQEAESRGFASVEWEYHKSYRDCTRVILRDEALADKLWKRLVPHFRVDDLAVRPFGYGADGFWVPKGVNPLFRITRYTQGGHFEIHRDGGFVVTDDYRSVYTLMIYLKKPYQGGETRFFDSTHEEPFTMARTPPREPVASLKPQIGTAVVFTHDVAHQGAAVENGEKYVLRTDILFERTLHLGNDLAHPLHHAAEQMYQESIRLQKEGLPRASTDAYVRATEIHARISSTPANGAGCHLASLHTDVIEEILPLLSVCDVAALMQTCRALLYKCRSPVHWYVRYQRDFKDGLVKLDNDQLIVTHDWFVLYGSRLLVERYLPVICLDVGARYTKFATTQLKCDRLITERWAREKEWNYQTGPDPVMLGDFQGKINSVFRRQRGHYWSAGSAYCDIMARVDDHKYEHWGEPDDRYGEVGYKFFPFSYPVEPDDRDGKPIVEVNIGVWTEIIGFVSAYCLGYSHSQRPVILAIPPHLKKRDAQSLILQLAPRIPAGFLGAVASPVLVAARHRVRNAIVVSVGARFAWISVVQELRMGEWKKESWYPHRCKCVELTQGLRATAAEPRVVKTLAKTAAEIKQSLASADLPVIVSGGYAALYRGPIGDAMGVDPKGVKVSADPDMDVAVGGVVYATLPDVRAVLLKTPVVQKPDAWYNKKDKLNWESMESALKRYGLPTLDDSQARMWDVLENL